MAKFFTQIDADVTDFIERQRIFFVATAPLAAEARINLSPKGMDTFRVIDQNQVAYLDLTGSGNETSAHLVENGRITFMFCAFEGPPNIVRLYGRGRVALPTDEDWERLASRFPSYPGVRQIIIADIDCVQTSCGFAVPIYEYQSERPTLIKWAEQKGETELAEYRMQKNTQSIDGLPTALTRDRR